MSLGNVSAVAIVTPDPMKRLAAAVLALAVDDLNHQNHRQDAYRFLHSGECEIYAGLIGADYFDIYKRVQRIAARN